MFKSHVGYVEPEKKSSQAAWLAPRCATPIGKAAARKTRGRKSISFTNGMAIPYNERARYCVSNDIRKLGALIAITVA